MTVTLNLINGFSFGRPVWYISMDASIPLAASIEHNTYAPLMGNLLLGNDDSFASPIERIFIATNGAEGCDNPQRQGLSADLADGHRPNNTLGGIPTLALDYSPAWDANLYTWTEEAISKGYRQQLREEFQILTYAQDGLITGASATAPFGSAGSPSIAQSSKDWIDWRPALLSFAAEQARAGRCNLFGPRLSDWHSTRGVYRRVRFHLFIRYSPEVRRTSPESIVARAPRHRVCIVHGKIPPCTASDSRRQGSRFHPVDPVREARNPFSRAGGHPLALVILRGFPGYQCPYCVKQVHDFVDRASDFKAKNARVLLVYPGPPAGLDQHAREFLEKQADLPSNVVLVIDPDYKVTNLYGLRWDAPHETAYPSTFILDGSGTVVFEKVSRGHGDRLSAQEALDHLSMH